jgi:hypothetical protein
LSILAIYYIQLLEAEIADRASRSRILGISIATR